MLKKHGSIEEFLKNIKFAVVTHLWFIYIHLGPDKCSIIRRQLRLTMTTNAALTYKPFTTAKWQGLGRWRVKWTWHTRRPASQAILGHTFTSISKSASYLWIIKLCGPYVAHFDIEKVRFTVSPCRLLQKAGILLYWDISEQPSCLKKKTKKNNLFFGYHGKTGAI